MKKYRRENGENAKVIMCWFSKKGAIFKSFGN